MIEDIRRFLRAGIARDLPGLRCPGGNREQSDASADGERNGNDGWVQSRFPTITSDRRGPGALRCGSEPGQRGAAHAGGNGNSHARAPFCCLGPCVTMQFGASRAADDSSQALST